jgi:uncharacterized protein YjbK
MEQELKLRLLSRDDYEQLRALLGTPLRRVDQRNAYLDTALGELRDRRIMARIRAEADGLTLTVKWRASRREGYFEAEEEEAPVEAATLEEALHSGLAASLLAKLCPETRGADLATLRVVGSIHNQRQVFHVEGFALELDHTVYPNRAEDFELEIETRQPDAAWKLLERLLRESGARGELQTLTKYERFLDNTTSP